MSGADAVSALWNWSDTRRTFLRGYNAMDLIHEAIYEGRPVGRRVGTVAQDFLRSQSKASSYLNVIQSIVDTVVSRIGKRRSMPIIGCDDAEYSEKLYARRASRVLRRKMGKPTIEREMPLMLRDAVIRGDGMAEIVRVGGDVCPERFARCELVFDDGEPRLGGWPRTVARVYLMDRDELIALYPERKKDIESASPAQRDIWSPYDYDAPIDQDMVEVIKGWRLPTSPGAPDGKYVRSLRGVDEPLEERKWTRPRFPIARLQWTPANRSFLGIGLVQQLAGSQNKVNELWNDHQEALYWGSGLKIFTQRGSNVNKSHLRPRHPIVVEHDGARPEFIAPNPASTQAMDSLRWQIQEMYEISGISQLSASGKSPLGSDPSGKALDTMEDIQSDRLNQFESQYSMSRVDIGQGVIDEAKDMASEERTDDAPPLAPWIEAIDWSKFDFDSGTFTLNIEPISFLTDSRSGKLNQLQDMAKIPGLLNNPLITASLFEEPDIARANRHLLGPMRALEKVAEKLGDPSVPLEECVPTPYMMSPPGLALEVIKGEHDNAYSEGASDEELGRYRWFLQLLEGEEKRLAPPAMPADPMAGGPMPPGPMDPMAGAPPMPGPPVPGPQMSPLIGPDGGIGPMMPDPLGGAASQLAAGMPLMTQGFQ